MGRLSLHGYTEGGSHGLVDCHSMGILSGGHMGG